MNNTTRSSLVFILSILLWACQPEPTDPHPDTPVERLKEQVEVWITHKLAELDDVTCNDAAITEKECELKSVKFSEGSFIPDNLDRNQTILILDSGLQYPAIVRYRSRVKAAYTQIETGYYSNDINYYDPSITLPSFIIDILREVDSFTPKFDTSSRVFIPAAWLSNVSDKIETIFPYNNYLHYIYHGFTPFLYLLEHNPEAEFVIAPAPRLFKANSNLFCHPHKIAEGQTQNNLTRLQERIVNIADDFKKNVIKGEGVEYINYSGGYTLETVKTRWQQLCATELPDQQTLQVLLNSIKPFFEVLFNTQGVFGFQATDINMNPTNNPLDIDTDYINRMRVGDFTTLESHLPEDGVIKDGLSEISAPKLLPNRQNSRQWIDIFINFGIELVRPFPFNDTPLMQTDFFGLTSYPISSMSPSWAAPVALSRAIHVKNSVFPDAILDDHTIKQIHNKMTPIAENKHEDCVYNKTYGSVCKRQDPSKHRQHEVYRLNYLD